MKTKQRLWRSLDELQQNSDFVEQQVNEFTNDTEAPAETGTTRRHFMGVMGASMAMAGMAGCVRRPEDFIMPYSRAPEEFLPGVYQHFATATHIAGNAIGLLVESNEGRPTKIEGNPDHPMSFGRASALHQGMVLDLYDPARMRTPRKDKVPTDWGVAADYITSHFAALQKKSGRGLAIVCEAIPSPTFRYFKARMRETFPQSTWHTWEPVSNDTQRAGTKAAFGVPLRPKYEINMATVVVALDSDFLGSEGDTVANAFRWAQTRKIKSDTGEISRLYSIEGRFSLTGTNADHRLRLHTSRVEQFTWALINALAGKKAFPVLVKQTAAVQAKGLSAEAVKFANVVAEDLLDNAAGRRYGLVIAGRRATATTHALTALINQAIGARSKTVYYFPDPRRGEDEAGDMEGLRTLAGNLESGKVDTVLVLGANPVYSAPADLKFGEVFQKAKTRIVLADQFDETARLATLALPRTHFLEAWGDVVATDGTLSIQQPLIAPLHGAWSELELLSYALNEPKNSGYALVRGFWKKRLGATGFHRKWRRWLHDGIQATPFFGAFPGHKKPRGLGDLKPTPVADAPTERSLEVVFVEDATLFDGRFANNSWLQETPDPISKITWDNTLSISVSTAAKISLQNEDRATLSVGGRQVDGVIWITPGIADGTVVVALGYGRDFNNFLPYHDEGSVGFSVSPIRVSTAPDLQSGGKLTKKAGTYPLACVQRYGSQTPPEFAGFKYPKRELVRETDLASYHKKPAFAKEGIIRHGEKFPDGLVVHPEGKSIYPDWDYSKGHQWGMSIDLNSCTGCNACLVACNSENTVMSVGKDQVRRGREMHWIRMDRYFVSAEGADPDAVQVVHQPLGCQHCETAPCENVCPVAATTHTPEGLNDMVYNRCIGTRYCANNCPFKVRRFNFYNYTKGQDELIQMQRNPNVTVRFRGVIEKCSYCVQRINHGKRQARMAEQAGKTKEAKAFIDKITPACQQTCPADAIVFGDINDPTSEVAKMRALSRDYHLLTELNLKTRTSYLAKVRNPNPKLVG